MTSINQDKLEKARELLETGKKHFRQYKTNSDPFAIDSAINHIAAAFVVLDSALDEKE